MSSTRAINCRARSSCSPSVVSHWLVAGFDPYVSFTLITGAFFAKKAWGEKLKKAVDDYAGKLRAQSKVETYLKRVQ